MTLAPRFVDLVIATVAIPLLLGACARTESPTNQSTAVGTSSPPAAAAGSKQAAEPIVAIRPRVSADALTLQELIADAHTIVLGVVKSIEHTSVQLRDGDTTSALPIRVVTLSVTRAFKGPVTDGGSHVVRQSTAESAPLEIGEEVLWYLDEPSEIGLTQPLGFYSGDFRISVVNDQRQAMSLRGNAELWQGSLWTGAEGIDQGDLLNSARGLGIASARQTAMIAVGSSAPSNALPLDLLLSATASQVRRPQ